MPRLDEGILHTMVIGERLRELREARKFSQGEIEKRTGCLRCYTSRVENGHTVPSVETLEKYARALEVPMYKLFIENNEKPKKPNLPQTEFAEAMWGRSEKERRELRQFAKALSRMDDQKRNLLLAMAVRMAGRNRTNKRM
jgi:transcriptional regulator with XRE-family HTH domain